MNAHKWFVSIVLLACLLFSACAPAAAPTQAANPVPLTASTALPPTAIPLAASKAPLPTAVSSPVPQSINTLPTQAPGTAFEGLSSGLNNAAQARIRTVSEVMGAPNTDVYVNGLRAFDGGVAQQNIGAGQFSGWLYVTPGTYAVALVPHDGTLDQALFAPKAVNVEAGHRYTIAAMGQLAAKDIHAMVVDETTLIAAVHPSPTDTISIDINNLSGADSVTEECNGQTAANIKYGEAVAYLCASGTPAFKTVANGKTQGVLGESTSYADPSTSYTIPWFGPYPAPNYDSVGSTSQGTSELNVLDFLAGYSGRNVSDGGNVLTFGILLAAIDKAGLRDQFANTDPNLLIAPTDGAFDLLPQDKRDALLNDPKALTQLLNAHIVDGYFPFGCFSGSTYGTADRTVTNRLGQQLKYAGDFINNIKVGPNYTVGNGYRVQVIYSLLPVK